MIKLGILGIRGKMGRAICEAAQSLPGLKVVMGWSRTLSPDISGIMLSKSVSDVLWGVDVILDFSHADALPQTLNALAQSPKPYILGLTGFDLGAVRPQLDRVATKAPLLHAPNTNLTVALLNQLLQQCAASLDPSFDVDILDIHHRHKQDTPSGTALSCAHTLQKVYAQRGKTFTIEHAPLMRTDNQIAIHSLRAGETASTTEVIFQNAEAKLALSCEIFSRVSLARGALQAAKWLRNQAPGFYTMEDMMATRGKKEIA